MAFVVVVVVVAGMAIDIIEHGHEGDLGTRSAVEPTMVFSGIPCSEQAKRSDDPRAMLECSQPQEAATYVASMSSHGFPLDEANAMLLADDMCPTLHDNGGNTVAIAEFHARSGWSDPQTAEEQTMTPQQLQRLAALVNSTFSCQK